LLLTAISIFKKDSPTYQPKRDHLFFRTFTTSNREKPDGNREHLTSNISLFTIAYDTIVLS